MVETTRIADLPKGTPLNHWRRGLCSLVEMDESDSSGGTAWVAFVGYEDDPERSSTTLLTPVAPEKSPAELEVARLAAVLNDLRAGFVEASTDLDTVARDAMAEGGTRYDRADAASDAYRNVVRLIDEATATSTPEWED
jgi:hypothetical protein